MCGFGAGAGLCSCFNPVGNGREGREGREWVMGGYTNVSIFRGAGLVFFFGVVGLLVGVGISDDGNDYGESKGKASFSFLLGGASFFFCSGSTFCGLYFVWGSFFFRDLFFEGYLLRVSIFSEVILFEVIFFNVHPLRRACLVWTAFALVTEDRTG